MTACNASEPTPTSTCHVRVGTSGFSFPGWLGFFYPRRLPARQMLRFYASRFDTVELNFSFYRMPTPVTVASLVNNTPDKFAFFVKAHHFFTHTQDLSLARVFLDGIRPLLEADKLAGLLCQFPQSFKNTQRNRLFLKRLRQSLGELPLAIEFRDRTWASVPVFNYLADHGLSLVSVDEPELERLFPRLAVPTSSLAYLRFHSRNADNWYDRTRDRYDYSYSNQEMSEWLPLLESISARARNIFIYFNNCHQAQAAENAEAMKALIRKSGLARGLTEPEIKRLPLLTG